MEFFRLRYKGKEIENANRKTTFFPNGYGLVFDSCGTNPEYVKATKSIFPDAKVVSRDLIDWADKVVCMESEHSIGIKKIVPEKKCIIWNLPDTFDFFDRNLIEILNKIDFDEWLMD
jgi:predicted protein tyrosine phosphatase